MACIQLSKPATTDSGAKAPEGMEHEFGVLCAPSLEFDAEYYSCKGDASKAQPGLHCEDHRLMPAFLL